MSGIGEWEIVDSGVTRKIHPTGKKLMMMEVEFEVGAVGKVHSHPHEQLTYCLKGKLEFKLNEKIHTLSKGESLYIPSNTEHGVIALEPSSLLDTFTPLREDLLS
ncbi:cupin domain-containing protein [Paraliobacillus sediminis]|uniref:cupin domain-containing protein n=1 Tax=Paraliobacillus sediminis TaxID=1885916 RepID=UPI000E3CED98|nr:cupin domain-containing protein [Paraliobacillus sediminis]